MNAIGIMQGRLLPSEDGRIQCFPSRGWREEFPRAGALGLDSIEWIYEAYGAERNPVTSADGVVEMRALVSRWSVRVASLCGDVLMDYPLFRVTTDAARYAAGWVPWLLSRCRAAGIERLVLPFVGRNEMRTQDELDQAVVLLRGWAKEAEQQDVELHLESSLDPERFVWLLDQLPLRFVKITYDIGNSVQFRFDAREEFDAYDDRIGSVHIKDSRRSGETVPLGEGDAAFGFCFARLRQIGYQGPYILQAARVPGESEMTTIKRYMDFVKMHLEQPVGAQSGSEVGR